ncbi:cupin domain-containing protein [Pacificoceanicola onchidii]|uniref:cupin domain-containing protein n=1 Tax=Pacificoceanicola onchidii TaxID=2562685 RepID=UPI0010A334CE|nr:cupin domain-containing protein [Pacificoceanicola onchidii]
MRITRTLACGLALTVAGTAAVAHSCEHSGWDITTKINGEIPPGEVKSLVDTSIMADTITSDGQRLVVMKGTRKAGTRVGIHIHKFGGHTCVLSGAITDFVEGLNPGLYPAGTCYYMPPNTPMTAANLGTEDAVLIDTFILPPGEDTITIVETCDE